MNSTCVSGEGWVRVVCTSPMDIIDARAQMAGPALLFALSLAVSVALGCGKDTQAAAEPPRAASAPAEPVPERTSAAMAPASAQNPSQPNAAEAAATSRFAETGFDLEMKPKGAYKVGQASAVEVLLAAKTPYHVNDKYPLKFKLKESEGVKFASMIVKREDAKIEEKRALMNVAFTPETEGKKTIAGQLSFSVCTADRCLIEKRDLALAVDIAK
jgi:pyruvate/2-oxoglutarate dehydrogenase complex dihydrolipoamide acyltransferase (E2) component